MAVPSWLLLVWSGFAATCAAAIAGTLLGGAAVASWSLAPRPRSTAHGFAWSLLAGVIAYPLVYGAAFEVLQRADLRSGLIIGTGHGVLAFVAADPRGSARNAFRCAAAHLVYGVVIAFLYVTP